MTSSTHSSRRLRWAIVQFPGSNCDQDCLHVLGQVLGHDAYYVWHKSHSLDRADAVIIPGGFSYGDYLRCGAIARLSPVMEAVREAAEAGTPVLGICNGFQILCEAGLLPGALLRNQTLQFRCQTPCVRVENAGTIFTRHYHKGDVLRLPIAHGDGNYFADADTLESLEARGQVVLRYCEADGQVTPEAAPNGAANNIAGICNEAGNVLGLMPHPERASESILGSVDGLRLFTSLADAVLEHGRAWSAKAAHAA